MSASISKVTVARLAYYRDQVAAGREDYYSGAGERPPTRAAFEYDSNPDMTELDVAAVLAELQNGMLEHAQVAAYDLTFSPPKSASILWALSDPQTARIIEAAHHRAVQDALASIEWYTRLGHQGCEQYRVDHPSLALNFQHRTSRALDPQLHSHVLIENRVTYNGKDRTLDGTELYAQTKSAGLVYNLSLRTSLTRDLAVAWTPTLENGVSGDILGIPQKLIEHFSSRRQEIESKLDAWKAEYEKQNDGRTPSKREEKIAAEGFCLSTRKAKKGAPSDTMDLREYWRADALSILSPDDVLAIAIREGTPGLLTRAREAAKTFIRDRIDEGKREQGLLDSLVGVRSTAERAVDDVITALEGSHHPSLNRYQVNEELYRVLPMRGDEAMADYKKRVDDMYQLVEADTRIVLLTGEAEAELDNNVRGLIKARQHRITTVAHLEKELDLFEDLSTINLKSNQKVAVEDLRMRVNQLADDELADGTLNPGQAEALKTVLSGDAMTSVLIGAAGTGKTTTLKVLKAGLGESGWNCLGLAKSGRAVNELAEAIGNSMTLDRWRIEQLRDRGFDPKDPEALEAWRNTMRDDARRMEQVLSPTQSTRQMIIIDEASFAETDVLSDVALYVRSTHSRLLLCGDHKQLGAVDKGGILMAIALSEKEETRQLLGMENVPVAMITDVVRQRETWERDASRAIREGGKSAEKAIDTYVAENRLHIADNVDRASTEVAEATAQDIANGLDVIAMAYNNEVVGKINRKAHEKLLAQGYLSPEPIPGLDFHEKERIRLTQNFYADRKLIASNNEVFTVLKRTGSMVQLEQRRNGKKKQMELPVDFIADHSQLAYGLTTHGAQGMTVDDNARFIVTAQTIAESFYVGISRARASNHIWASKGDIWGSPDDTPIPQPQQSDRERIITGLKTLVSQHEDSNAVAAAQHEARSLVLAKKFLEQRQMQAEKEARATERVRPGVQQGWGLEL